MGLYKYSLGQLIDTQYGLLQVNLLIAKMRLNNNNDKERDEFILCHDFSIFHKKPKICQDSNSVPSRLTKLKAAILPSVLSRLHNSWAMCCY